MRLLKRKSDGEFGLTEFLEDNIPPYAILSHTWGANGEEVTFKDLMDHTGKSKAGFNKIRFCREQAANNGLNYFWVDTCCIDKSSSAELTEAINSMFRWYRNAVKCYVYMSDVLTLGHDENDDLRRSTWKLAFRKSRWFTRGWTLQELIAPKSVEFFSSEGIGLGDKRSMEQQIYEITSIPIRALRGDPLSDFSIAERMSWVTKRETTREEDKAYSLLGIFDIHMPLIYGEGQEKSFIRLREEMEKPSPQGLDARLKKIRQWLSPPDPSDNYRKALNLRQADTGLWFLESEQYDKWKTDTASFLWLYGIPGCGKTILSSTILQSIFQYCADDPGKVVGYFYFDFNDAQKQKPEPMIRSLISQLAQQCVKIPMILETLFSSCENGQRQPSLYALLDVLQEMIHQFPQAYIVLDALDECTDQAKLMKTLESMARWQFDGLHLLVTSRKERDIESSLECLVEDSNIICLQSKLVDKDICRYVHQRLSVDKNLKKWQKDPDVVHEIETALIEGAQGMFRWAVCQLDILGKCRNRLMLRKSLATLPPTLDQTYDRILCAIDTNDSEYALRLLQWLTFSSRPLLVDEISEVIAINPERDPAFNKEEVLEEPSEVLSICSSLVTVPTTKEPFERVVTLSHYSVKEYLISERIRKGPAARYSMQPADCNEFIAKSCLGYLLQFQESGCISNKSVEEFKLARYSAEFWITHAQAASQKAEALNHLIMELFSTGNGAYLNWIWIYNPDSPWADNLDQGLEEVPTPLYCASLSGMTEIVRLLTLEGKSADVNSHENRNALQAASCGGHSATVELLLEKGADVHAHGGGYGNALRAASCGGYTTIVELLLSKGADINADGGHFGSALQAASGGGHSATAELLLSKGADVNAQGGYYSNALQAASSGGHLATVGLLLNKGAKVNAQGGHLGNALQAASSRGHSATIELLLSKGADVNAQGGYYGNALQAALERDQTTTVELLLSKGADVNAQRGPFGNALYIASERGHAAIVELLLGKGADVNTYGGGRLGNGSRRHFSNALQVASGRGHNAIVKLLLDKGADANVQGGDYSNALQAASEKGYTTIVELLLDKGANVNMQGGYYGNALQAASGGGYTTIVELLLGRGADINAQGGYYSNALQAASGGGHTTIVELLLNKGANVNAQGGYYSNALQAASGRGHTMIVELLLGKGAEVNAQGEPFSNPLGGGHFSSTLRGHFGNAFGGGHFSNALQAASSRGHLATVGLLLNKGAKVNTQGGHLGNALQAASSRGHSATVELR